MPRIEHQPASGERIFSFAEKKARLNIEKSAELVKTSAASDTPTNH